MVRENSISSYGGGYCNYNLLMVGPPGSGKTMLARRLSEIMSPMVLPKAIETTKMYSVVGRMPKNQPLEDKSVTISRVASILPVLCSWRP